MDSLIDRFGVLRDKTSFFFQQRTQYKNSRNSSLVKNISSFVSTASPSPNSPTSSTQANGWTKYTKLIPNISQINQYIPSLSTFTQTTPDETTSNMCSSCKKKVSWLDTCSCKLWYVMTSRRFLTLKSKQNNCKECCNIDIPFQELVKLYNEMQLNNTKNTHSQTSHDKSTSDIRLCKLCYQLILFERSKTKRKKVKEILHVIDFDLQFQELKEKRDQLIFLYLTIYSNSKLFPLLEDFVQFQDQDLQGGSLSEIISHSVTNL